MLVEPTTQRVGRRPLGTPAVLFVDDLRWDAFCQLSPRLRRAGIRTIRATSESHARSGLVNGLLFDRSIALDDDGTALRELVAEERILDIQFVETLGGLVRDVLGLLDDDVARQVGRRLAVMDKLAASRLFDGAGVRTPPVVSASEAASPGAAAATLGLPMVLKRRVGCGGDSVSITHTVASAIEAAARWDDDHDHYYEAYVDGEKLNYAAAVSARGIEQELTYRVSRWVQPVGTATQIETIDDPDLVALGRRAIEASGCTGLMNLDVIRDDDGRCWLIDFNARAFGGGANFLTVGLDVSEGYLVALEQRAEPPLRRSVVAASRIDVFPTSLRDPKNKGSVLRMASAFLRESFPYLRGLGTRYWLSEALRAPEAAAAASTQRRRRATRDDVAHAERIMTPRAQPT